VRKGSRDAQLPSDGVDAACGVGIGCGGAGK